MAQKLPIADVPKIEEKMECEDTPPDSEHAVGPPRTSSTTSRGVSSKVGTTSGSGSDKTQLELPTQDSAVSPKGSPRSSPSTSPKSKKASGKSGPVNFIMNAFRRSPKKSDKAAKVPKAARKESTTGPSSADKTSAATSSGSRDKKPKSLGDVKSEYHHKLSMLDYSSSEEDTVLTEVSDSSRQLLPDNLGRKDSISSCDTGAHISMLPSLDEFGAGNEPEKISDLSADERESTRASTERPLGEKQ